MDKQVENWDGKIPCAQGDVAFEVVTASDIPDTAKVVKPGDQGYVVAHSESGHNHVIAPQDGVEMFVDATNEFVSYLRIKAGVAADVITRHLKPGPDQHGPIKLNFDSAEDITLRVRNQQEHTVKGWERAID